MNYAKYHEQTLAAYKNVKYGGNSIYNSGCGPATLANALMMLGIADITVKDACAFAVSCGARVESGTDMHKLLAAAAKKWKITYTTTSSNAKLAAHLRAGGVAAMNQGSKYKVFSNGGHFVLAAAIDSSDRVTVIDSYWNAKKYKTWPAYHAKSKALSRCFVRTPLEWCGKATIDRSPSYYLISKTKKAKAQNPKNNTNTTTKLEEEYVVKNLEMQVNGSTQTIAAIENDGHNYVRLDQLPKLLPVVVGYDGKQPTMDTAEIKLRIDGAEKQLPGGIIAPGKSLAYVSDLASVLGYKVGWDAESKTVTLEKD